MRSTRARTTARWYDAARSAFRSLGGGAQVANGVQQRRLDAGEGEVHAGDARDGEAVRGRVAGARQPVERRAAGVAEAEQARALVEGLAGGVVDRPSQGR